MEKEEYQKIVASKKVKEPRLKNALIAFLTGGCLGLGSQILSKIMQMLWPISQTDSYSFICLIMIFLASLFTALGFFDDWVTKTKCGLIIPTTGFAHSVTATAIEFKKDGMVTGLGSNIFRLAGSVILYAIIAAFFLCVVKGVYLWLV